MTSGALLRFLAEEDEGGQYGMDSTHAKPRKGK